MVQSTPSITGIYSMNSSKLIDCIYYASDNESVVCADDTFKLEEGVTYQFLIKLVPGTSPLAFYRGPLAQFVSPVAHTHKRKNRAEGMENQTNFSVQQPVRVFLKI